MVGAIAIGAEPFVLAVNPDTGHLFVACGDRVNVYRTADWSLVTTIPVPPGAEEGITVDTVRDHVYVTSRDSDTLTVIQDAAPPLVLFTSDRDGNTEIYSMLPDGREQTRLTTHRGFRRGRSGRLARRPLDRLQPRGTRWQVLSLADEPRWA